MTPTPDRRGKIIGNCIKLHLNENAGTRRGVAGKRPPAVCRRPNLFSSLFYFYLFLFAPSHKIIHQPVALLEVTA